MTYKSTSHKYFIVFSVLFAILVCLAHSSDAQMPDYDLLNPIVMPQGSVPNLIAFDRNENLYVTEPSLRQLTVYDQSGDKRYKFTGVGSPSNPLSVAVDEYDRIYIGNNTFNDSVDNVGVYRIVNTNGVYSLQLQYFLGGMTGYFTHPSDIEIDSNTGNVYIVDNKENIIKVYNPDDPGAPTPSDSLQFTFNGTANGGGQFEDPTSIAIDYAAGELIVLDHPLTANGNGGARIQRFDMNGNYIFGYDTFGDQIGDMWRPMQIDLDSIGRLYVTDSQQGVVLIYQKNGSLLEYLGVVFVDQEHKLTNAVGIAVSGSNLLFVTQTGHKEIQRYGLIPYTFMDVSPSSLTFAGDRGGTPPAAQDVTINNNGSASLGWTVSKVGDWITISDTSGSTDSLASSILNVGVNLSGLSVGTYSGSVTITSASGGTEDVLVSLTVSDVELVANAGTTYYGTEGEAIILDASNSIGAIQYYRWDIDNNGSFEYENTVPTQSHVFASSGTYYIQLEIEDDQGFTDSEVTIADISDAVPSAGFTSTPLVGTSPMLVNFTNTSTGYDAPLTYEWDFDNDGSVDSTDENPSYLFSAAGTYSVALKVTDSDGSTNTLLKTDYITLANGYNLHLTVSGSGTVSSETAGIDCGTDCDEAYEEGSTVTLSAVPDAGSVFTGWSGGGCSGTDDCSITITADTDVTATFGICSNLPVRILETASEFASVQDAYDAADDGNTIQTQAARFNEAPVLNLNKPVIIEGGYTCDYSPGNKRTILNSTTISDGLVTIGGFEFE